ncbi:hypothetical protein RHMOL_Rhmol05G0165100 [Rhododendron molle]|uniref:Uncharacterized protein n=1 Tax=Rhododendron molle TaxID=49168 RepID=A0ACC0NRT7_RHOML|nr:hypothetical protein RHMOL_Rhmol05G0165100 [Rhododendron molle]
MAEESGNGGGGEVVDQSEDRGQPMAAEERVQQLLEVVASIGADTMRGGDGNQGREQETAGGDVRCAIEEEPGGLSTEARASPVIEGSSGGVSGSGAIGDDTGPSQTPSRDSAKSKGVTVEEE